MNKKHWNTVGIESGVPDAELRKMIDTPTISWPKGCRNLGQRLQLDLSETQLQRVAGDVEEIVGRVSESDM
jgi:hypothetical protein